MESTHKYVELLKGGILFCVFGATFCGLRGVGLQMVCVWLCCDLLLCLVVTITLIPYL